MGAGSVRTLGTGMIRWWGIVAALALLAAGAAIALSPAAASQAPATPSSVTVERSDGTLTASWPAVSGATEYHVTYSGTHKQSWQLASLNHTTNSITITGVDNAKSYYVAARARNAHGWSGWRDSSLSGPYVPPGTPPTATPTPTPTPTPLPAPSSVTVTRSDGTYTATWPAVDGATKYHIIDSDNNGQSYHRVKTDWTGTTITYAARNEDTYIVAVMAANDVSKSGWTYSDPAPPYHPMTAPSSITVTRGNGTLTATWPAVTGAAAYHVTYSGTHKQSWLLGALNHTSNTITITGVDNATSYYVAARARNAYNKWSRWTDSALAGPYTLPSPSPTPLAAPANVAVRRTGSTLVVTWGRSPTRP